MLLNIDLQSNIHERLSKLWKIVCTLGIDIYPYKFMRIMK